MAAKNTVVSELESDAPIRSTFIHETYRGGWRDGVFRAIDGSVWIARMVPLSPVADAKTTQERLEAGRPILDSFYELAQMGHTGVSRRALSKGAYREFQLLSVNIPQWWTPPYEHPGQAYLSQSFPRTQETRSRHLMLTVRLRDRIGGDQMSLRSMWDSVASTFTDAVPLDDYRADAEKVATGLARAGLRVPTPQELRAVDSWWNMGRSADVHIMPQPDCFHVFSTLGEAQAAKRAVEAGRTDYEDLSPTMTVTMVPVSDLDFNFEDASDPNSLWLTRLIDADTLAVSIRGKVEPAVNTRDQLRRNRKKNMDDAKTRDKSAKMERSEQIDHIGMLGQVEQVYAQKGAPPTIVDGSVVAAFSGYISDVPELTAQLQGPILEQVLYRQSGFLSETMLGSPVRANPFPQELPAQVVAFSGASGLSVAGDKPLPGSVLLMFSERDKQPMWFHPMAAHDGDTLPITVVAGATGSGKSVFALWILDQLARQGTPSIFIDPKPESDHSEAVLNAGGQVYSLDSLLEADGVFDPIRFAANNSVGISLASSMLTSINPWGSRGGDFEVPIISALSYGVQHGAKCTGQALKIARASNPAWSEMIDAVFDLMNAVPMFRALFGMDPQGESLSAFNGITLIKVGSAALELPKPGAMASTPQERISMAIVRMMVFGSAYALTNRDGVVALDEGWVFLSANPREIETLGRLARSQRVSPMIFTQKISDALNAGLRGYISRGIILPIEDAEEAEAACNLFQIEPTPERLQRITSPATIGAAGGGVQPNYTSLRALRDPETDKVIRGTVGLYSDIAKRCVPGEIVLPGEFLKRASTRKADIVERRAKRALAEQTAATAQKKARISVPRSTSDDVW